MAEAETVLITALRVEFPSARVATETPSNLGELVAAGTPVFRVTRFGGADEFVHAFDNPHLDVDVYGADRDAARTLAYDVRRFIRHELPGQTHAGATVLRTRTFSGPVWTPYPNTAVRRFTYSTQLRLHNH